MSSSSAPAPSVAAIAAGLSGVTLPTSLVQGELVKIPASPGTYDSYAVSPSTVSAILQAYVPNKDGTNQGVLMTANPGTANGCSIKSVLYGRVIGVRFLRNTSTPPKFCVAIDGVAYAVSGANYAFNGQPASVSTVSDGDSFVILASNLADGPHSVEVLLASDPLNVTTYALIFYGFVVERRAGYVERARLLGPNANGTLTTSAVAITNPSSPGSFAGLRKVIYSNTGAAPTTVSVNYGGSLVWQATLAVGAFAEFDPGDAVSFSGSTGTFAHLASPATVSFIAFGRN